MDLVLCSDKNYIIPCGIVLCSICENNKEEKIQFFLIIDHEVSFQDTDTIFHLIKQYPNKEIEFIYADSVDVEALPGLQTGYYITKAAYYRLFLTELLPQTIDKILYLDSDVIVRDSLSELWNVDITNYALGVVTDMCETGVGHYNRLKYPMELGYFNSGVLLINLKYWREHNAFETFMSFLKTNYNNINCHDQDVLNYIFRFNKLQLPLKYNFQDGFMYKEPEFEYWKYADEIESALKNPCIIHYTRRKPWQKECEHPFKNVFLYYQNKTPWDKIRLLKTNKKINRTEKIKRFMRLLHLIVPEWNPFKDINVVLQK